MAEKYMVLKPIVYHGKDKTEGPVVQPGAVLDFSHLDQTQLNILFANFTLGPADKKELEKHIKLLKKQAEDAQKAKEKKAQLEADAIEMRRLMKQQANLKESN